MLVTVLAEKNYTALRQQIKDLIQITDAIELRLDYLEDLDIAEIQQLKHDFSIPMIFTLRKKSQGGLFYQTEDQRLKILEKLAALAPEFIDLEFDVPIEFAMMLKQQHPMIQLIRSYHDFEKTPDNLTEILDQLRHDVFSIYKIVTFAQSTCDCLNVLFFVNQAAPDIRLAGFCMGELGVASRVLGPVVGGALQYACVDDAGQVAPGQLSLSTLLEFYRIRSMNSKTNIYALIGSPAAVDKSAGHIVHNRAFEFLGQNAVYVKLGLEPTALEVFFKLIKLLPFKGFSVTMPFKQDVMPYLDQIDPMANAIHSVNTVVIDKGKLMGYNTDAKGALDAIENKLLVAHKTVVIIGAGGAARAIGHEAIKRQAKVVFINRTAKKAHELAEEMNCEGYGFDEIKQQQSGYDVLVNTTPLGMSGQPNALPIPEEFIIPHRVVMDTVYNPIETLLLQKAQSLDCTLVYGYEMFINQAVQQLQLWFGVTNNLKPLQQICSEAFEKSFTQFKF